jgi:hypothetical protein
MANYNKSFNFRNGVQVDDDNFIVNANGLVGIGTSIPTEFLDVHGTAKVTGLVTATNLAITGVSTFYSDVKIGSGITFNPSTGAVRATTFFGSAAGLTGIYAIAVDGWYVNAGNISTTSKVGIGTDIPNYSLQVGRDPVIGNGLSIDAITGNVNTSGIITATRFSGPGDGVTNLNASVITSGTLDNARLPQNINVSGIVTAYSLTGFGTNLQGLNATNITNGTLNNSRLPQNISITGIITASTGVITSLTNTNLNNTGIATLGVANASRLLVSGVTTSTGGFVGNITGTASSASSLTGSPNITVSNITSSNINNTGIITSLGINNTGNLTSGTSVIGISTISTRLYAESIGVGTNSPSSDIHIRRSSTSRLQVTSDTAEAIVAVGRSTTLTGSNGALRFGNTSGLYPYSNTRTLDIINYDSGNINNYLQLGSSGSTGSFNWFHGQSPTNLMTLTNQGSLGLGVTLPTNTIHVSGTSTVTGNSYVGGDFYADNNAIIGGNLTVTGNLNLTSSISANLTGNVTGNLTGNVNSTSGISTFNNIKSNNNIIVSNSIGIGTDSARSSLDVLSSGGIFGFVGIGTTSIADEDTNLYAVGNSEFYGDVSVSGITTVTGPTLFSRQLSVSGVSTFAGITTVTGQTLFSRQLSVSGVTTSQNGFTSGIGVTNPVKITVSGSILTFTVAGVGSTSLTLF